MFDRQFVVSAPFGTGAIIIAHVAHAKDTGNDKSAGRSPSDLSLV